MPSISPCAANNFFHQGGPDAFATRFGPHINAPDVAFVALFQMMETIESRGSGNRAILKAADHEIVRWIARAQSPTRGFHRGVLMLFRRIGKRRWIVAQPFDAQLPPDFSIGGGNQADFHYGFIFAKTADGLGTPNYVRPPALLVYLVPLCPI